MFNCRGLLGLEIQTKIVSMFFSAISGDFWHNTSSKTPDSESSHLANHFAPNISCRGILGLEIEAKIVSSRFLQISVTSGGESQKHRILIPCVVLIILHRLSALGAFWGSKFGPNLEPQRAREFITGAK